MKKPVFKLLAVAALAMSAFGANAADANITSNAIYGGGNSNGGFTVNTAGGVEIGLRTHIRLPSPMDDAASIGSNNNGTYSQAAGAGTLFGSPNAALWNFDWSVNTDPGSTGTGKVGDYTYQLSLDFNPGLGVNFFNFDPISVLLADHSFGDNSTAMSAGVEASDAADYALLKSTKNLVQNSWNYDFFDSISFPFDPTANGQYTIRLQALSGSTVVSSSQINVIVGTGATVPEPGSLALVGLALGGLAIARKRKMSK